MEIKSTDLVSFFEKAFSNEPKPNLDEIGFVIQVGDSFCNIHGLKNAVYEELIEFEGGNKGIVMNLGEEIVSVFLIHTHIPVQELEIAKRTGTVFKVPTSINLLGRVVNATGHPIDGLGEIRDIELRPIEARIPDIIERSPINESLSTGILVIDALVPIGKGQRELLIGNRSTGKTTIALSTILNQKGKDVYCVYVSIGQRQASLAKIKQLLEEYDALSYTTIVSADASESALDRYLAPYVGCTIAEAFRDGGHDVLVVYDDLSNHAVAYREISLLMRRPPGREAYPGDIFYLHSRLLERAGKLSTGRSITALPIVQIQADDITAYIPTNLISITDGQLFLDTKLYNRGIRPAVNTELSVSRVGGAAQTNAVKQMTRALRLELAQYQELISFAQFGTELDPVSQARLKKGAIAYELLKQKEYAAYSFVDEALILFLLKENYLSSYELSELQPFATQFISYVQSIYRDLYNDIYSSKNITESQYSKLNDIAREFANLFKK